MKDKLNAKSVLAGAILGGVVMAILGAAIQPSQQIGRYQVSVASQRSIVIDTATSQLWERTEFGTPSQRSDADFDKVKNK
jgi:hypothetical protein